MLKLYCMTAKLEKWWFRLTKEVGGVRVNGNVNRLVEGCWLELGNYSNEKHKSKAGIHLSPELARWLIDQLSGYASPE